MSWQVTVFLSILAICMTAITLKVFSMEYGITTSYEVDEDETRL